MTPHMQKTLSEHPNVGPPLTWVTEGQKVWAPKDDEHYMLCVVTCAAGFNARVWSGKHDLEVWRDVRDCFAYQETVH